MLLSSWLIPCWYRFIVVTKTIVTLFFWQKLLLPWYKFVRNKENNSKHHTEWHFISVQIACYRFYQTWFNVKGLTVCMFVYTFYSFVFMYSSFILLCTFIIIYNRHTIVAVLDIAIQPNGAQQHSKTVVTCLTPL